MVVEKGMEWVLFEVLLLCAKVWLRKSSSDGCGGVKFKMQPRKRVRVEDFKREFECMVCFSWSWERGKGVRIHKECGRAICSPCMTQWGGSCPTCRQELSGFRFRFEDEKFAPEDYCFACNQRRLGAAHERSCYVVDPSRASIAKSVAHWGVPLLDLDEAIASESDAAVSAVWGDNTLILFRRRDCTREVAIVGFENGGVAQIRHDEQFAEVVPFPVLFAVCSLPRLPEEYWAPVGHVESKGAGRLALWRRPLWNADYTDIQSALHSWRILFCRNFKDVTFKLRQSPDRIYSFSFHPCSICLFRINRKGFMQSYVVAVHNERIKSERETWCEFKFIFSERDTARAVKVLLPSLCLHFPHPPYEHPPNLWRNVGIRLNRSRTAPPDWEYTF